MIALRGMRLARLHRPLTPLTKYRSLPSLRQPQRSPFNSRYAATLTLPTEESEVPPRTAADDSEIPPGSSVGHLYFDSVFPLALGTLDPRAYLPIFQGDAALQSLKTALPDAKQIGFEFRYLGTESRAKDGGAFLTFAYKPDGKAADISTSAILRRIPSSTSLSNDEAATLTVINSRIRPHLKPIHQFALSPSRLLPASMLAPPRAHIVLGTPWLEDLARFPSRTIKMSFYEGTSPPTEQQVWEMLRPYGRVMQLSIDAKANQATAVYARMRGATSARNCLYGASIGGRKVVIDYQPPMHTHKIWEWLSSHPRIVFPIVAFFLGSLSYAIFDPIRGWFIKSNVENTFDLEAYPLYAWLRKKTVGLFSRSSGGSDSSSLQDEWWERKAAADEIQSWLRESPSTFITISGPRGSGKHQLLQRAIKDTEIKHLSIDCEEISRTSKNAEAALIPAVAKQVGFFPVVNWINSLNQLIDLASVGLIGSKAGFSTPTDDQLKKVLSVTTTALISIKADTAKEKEKKLKALKSGGNNSKQKSVEVASPTPALSVLNDKDASLHSKEPKIRDELAADVNLLPVEMDGMEEKGFDTPVVIIDGFHHKGVKSDLLWTVLGDWAAELTTSKVAHVVFVSDNPVGMGKTLSRSLPNVPFETVVLADADEDRARGYVYAKLKELGKVETPIAIQQNSNYTMSNQSSMASLFGSSQPEEPHRRSKSQREQGHLDQETAKWVDLLGGRLTDLENLVQKVSLGQSVENAVKDIISRTVVEIRKNTFGDDLEDSKSLPWNRGQAWLVVEQLAEKEELPYYAILHDNFKGDEAALKALEQAEIISVRHIDSRPSSIRAGRPVIQQALQSLVSDQVFADMQRFLSNNSSIESCEKVIRDIEMEIRQLAEGINQGTSMIKGGAQAAKDRFEYLLEKLSTSQDKIRSLESKNVLLKQTLAQKEEAH